MPIYSIQGPDGNTYEIEGPVGATKAEVVAAIQAKMRAPAPEPAPTPFIAPAPSTQRTTSEAFKDIGASVVGGLGSLLQVPGQLTQLVPGLQNIGQAIAKPGELLEEKGESLKSQGLKVREALRSQAISEAEKEGILSSFATAITETIKDPALLSTFITGQLPQLLGPAAAAKVGKAVVMSRSGLEGAELAAQAGKIGTRSAIGAGAVMQGADISADTYKQAFEAAQKQGMSAEDANAAALTAARKAFALAAPISVASQYLPGGSAIERRLAGVAGKGRIKGALGEAISEGIEEGGGAFATNVGVLGVDPTRELTQGVGSAAGLGTLGGGVLGGVLGKATAPELPPELRPGETDRQAAERIQAEILAMKQAAQPPVAPPSPVLDTNKLYNLMAQPNGYGLVEQYKQRLAQLPETPETKAAIDEASFIQRRAVIEEIGRQPTKAVLDDKKLKNIGFKPNDGVYELLLGKDIANPDEIEAVTQSLQVVKAQEDISPTIVEKIDNFLIDLSNLQESIYPKGPPDVREAVTAPSGEGVPVAGKPSAGVAAEGVAAPVPGGVVPAVADVGQPAGGEGQKPAPVVPPVAETAEEVFREAALDWAEQNIKRQAPVESPVAPPAPAPLVAAPAVTPVQPAVPTTAEAPAAELTPAEVAQQVTDLKAQQTNLLTKAGKVPALRSPARQKYDALSAQIADLEGKQVTVKTRKPRKPPTTIMGSPMLAGIFNKIGGLHTSLMSEFSTRFITKGLDKNGKPIVRMRNPLVTGYGTLFNKKGKVDFGEIAEHLELEGYLEPGSLERDYKDAGERAKDLIKKALNREEVLPIQDRIDKDAQEREASERQRTLDIQEENRMIASGELQLEPEFEWSDAEIEQNLGLDREFQTDLEMYDMEPKDLEFLSDAELESDLTDAEQDQARRPPKADADAARQAAEGAAPGEAEALLTRPTEEGLRAKQEAAEKATAEEKRTRDAEQERLRKEQATKEERARADESAKDFELGKSAEEQMTGMGDLFGKKSLADIPATRWGEIERKAKAARETAEKAEATPEQAELNKEIEAKIDELGKVLSRIMGRFGLKDVALKLVEDMKAEGEYAQSVVRLALDAASPVQALRHESIHALKELGFFSPQQWSALEKQAKSKWIDQYLKNVNVNKEPLGEGEKSRYDAYNILYAQQGQQQGLQGDALQQFIKDAVIEEAIADAFGDFDVNKAPPGLMQAILNRLRNFFDGVKTVFGGEVTAEQVFRKAERGELKAEAAPAPEGEVKPSLRIMRGEERPDLGKNVTVDKVGKYFDDQIIQEFGGKLDYKNPQHLERAIQQATEEVQYQIKQKNSGLDWYEEDIQKAFKDTIKVLPELKKEDNRILFSVIAGMMSPETNARDNWFIASKAFEHYVKTGDIPGVNPENGNLWMGGTQSANKKIQLEFLDRMVKDLGVKKTVKWLMSPQTVKDINQYRAKYGNLKSGINGKATDLKPNGLFAFGEKIGPFISNINGIHDVTVDKWFTRTFNRYFGTMIGPDGKIVNAPTEPERRVVKELANRVAKNAGIKNYQVQSLLWFYEQRLFTELGASSPSYGFSDGARKFLDARGKGAVPAGAVFAKQAGAGGVKPSLRAPQTEAFKKWFGNSKVVDENGEPLVVYHGTNADISVFAPEASRDGAFHFGDPELANRFAASRSMDQGRGANVIPVYLSIQNPLVVPIIRSDDIDYAKAKGFDGIVATERRHFVAFNASQIKSATGNIGTFDITKPDIRYSLRDPIGLYSELENKVAQGPNKAPAASWKAYINGLTQKGVKPEEIEWSGVRDWLDLQTGPVSKDAVNAYLKQGGVKVEETSLGESLQVRELDAWLDRWADKNPGTATAKSITRGDAWYEIAAVAKTENQSVVLRLIENQETPAKYGQYQLPGGTNYREVLLTLPVTVDAETQRLLDEERYLVLGPEEQAKVDAAKKKAGIEYRSSHWDQPNVIAHIRLNDRTDADGNKVLFVEEIQSDWGQEGKKKGFSREPDAELAAQVETLRRQFGNGYGPGVFDDSGKRDPAKRELLAMRLREAEDRLRASKEGVPSAPFVTKTEGWLNLALKRIMVMAAEGGYDKVAFVNGEQSAERYDLSKQVNYIQWNPGDGANARLVTLEMSSGKEVGMTVRDGVVEDSFIGADGKPLEDVVGKEIAGKILAAESGSLRGLDLKVGGEGMKTFYNQIVPMAVKKLLPKVGGEALIEVKLPTGEPRRPGKPAPMGMKQPGFDVTPDMTQKVETTGLPRFSLRSTIPTAARQRIVQTTVTRDEKTFYQRIIEAISPSNFESFRADALNRYNQLSVYDKILAKAMGGVKLLANVSAEAAALLSDLGAGLTASALGVHDRMGGVPVYKNGITTISNKGGTVKGPTAIFSPLATQPGDYQAYQYWAAVKRGLRLLHTIDPKTGKVVERLITAADGPIAEALRKQYIKEFKIDFESIQEEWIKYNNGLVEFMLDTGVLSQDRADAYRQYADYLPFYRQMNGEETVGPKIFQSIAGVKPPKKIKGGEARLDDFLENIVRNTQSAIQAGVKNIAAQRAAQVAVSIQMATRLNYQSSAPNVFHVYENGRPISYVSEDALFINAIKSLGIPDLPFIGFLAGPANLLRNLVTKDPGFMLANLMRDSMSAWVTSGVKMKPMIDTISNFGSALAGKSPEFQALMNAGILGGYEFSQNVEASGREFGKALRKQANVKQPGMKGVLEFGAKPFTSLWEALEKGSTASDAATRIEIYKKTLAETGNEAEALYRALEVMNFNRKGSSAVVRILTAAVPFLNARMQGLDVLYRASTGNMNAMNAKQIQKNFFVRGATIAALSTAYWALTHDDDEYKKQEQETRDNYWLLPSMGVKIPIPFEIGVLFKVIPERILGYTMGSDTGEDFLKSMARNLMSTLSFNPIPQTALPIIETAANFSFFTMRPIVGQGLEGLQPAYQVGPGTSRLAETIGGATRGLPTELQISPAKLDQLINGYTGTMGMYMVNLMDAVFDMNTDSPKPSRRFEQMPLIRRFALDPEARGSVTAYYELKNKVDSVVRTSNMLERTMNYEELPGFLQDNMTMLASKDYLLDLEKTIKEFREMKIMIRSAQMSADSKRDAISSIEKMENQLTANIQYLKKLAKGG